jgi:hypothetical protein
VGGHHRVPGADQRCHRWLDRLGQCHTAEHRLEVDVGQRAGWGAGHEADCPAGDVERVEEAFQAAAIVPVRLAAGARPSEFRSSRRNCPTSHVYSSTVMPRLAANLSTGLKPQRPRVRIMTMRR